MGKGGIPDRWLPYSPMGSVIPGTHFIACKVPLKKSLLQRLPKEERFGPMDLLEAFPKTGLLIDLTNTTRYYVKEDFTDRDIRYEKIFCPGQVIPPNSIVKQFFRVVDDYLATEQDPDAVIVVHCTHGVNRTGYFICRYMIERLDMLPEEAVRSFQMARGHAIERENYVDDLKNGCKGGNESDLQFVFNNSISVGGSGTHHQRSYFSSGNNSNQMSNNNRHKRWDLEGDQQRNSNYSLNNKRGFTGEIKKETDFIQTNWRNQGDFQNPPVPLKMSLPTHHKRWEFEGDQQRNNSYSFNNKQGFTRKIKKETDVIQTNWRDHGDFQNPPVPLKMSLPTHHKRWDFEGDQQRNNSYSFNNKRGFTGKIKKETDGFQTNWPNHGDYQNPPLHLKMSLPQPPDGYLNAQSTRHINYHETSSLAYQPPRSYQQRNPPASAFIDFSNPKLRKLAPSQRFTPIPELCSSASTKETSSGQQCPLSIPENSLDAPTDNQMTAKSFRVNYNGRISNRGNGQRR